MKRFIFSLILFTLLLTACAGTPSANELEQQQQQAGAVSLVQNQPVPDLGGYSQEREVVIKTFLARNTTVATWSYSLTYDGKFIEICPSISYPIPYSTRLTSPEKLAGSTYDSSVIPNAEPNGLYTPADSAPTMIQCVNDDGSVSVVYWEWYVVAFPFRIKSDIQIERLSEPSFKIDLKKP